MVAEPIRPGVRNTRWAICGLAAAIAALACPTVSRAGFVVAKGYDLFQTLPGTTFFGQDFLGVEKGGRYGNTSMMIHRLSKASLTGPGTTTIGVRMDYLVLRSANQFNFMGKGNDYYFIRLRKSGRSLGTYDITFNADGSGGTFDASITFFYSVRKHTKGGKIVFKGVMTLTVHDVPWSRDPVTGQVLIRNKNYLLDHVDNAQDFFPSGTINWTDNTGDSLVVAPASPSHI